MNVEVRIYKRFDTDLLALHDHGISITKMMQEAVCAYANGQPCHFFIDEIVPFDMNDKKSIRLRLKFMDNDYNTKNLIKCIKHGYRSNFCKTILRNALIQQNIPCYMSNSNMFSMQETNAHYLNMQAFQNLKMCSHYKRDIHQVHITTASEHAKNHVATKNIAPAAQTQRNVPPTDPTPAVPTPTHLDAASTQLLQQLLAQVQAGGIQLASTQPMQAPVTSADAAPVQNTKTIQPAEIEEKEEENSTNDSPPQLAGNADLMAIFDDL